MRNKFDQQLEKLNNDLIAMGAQCENSIACAIKAMQMNDRDMAEETIKNDEDIDEREREIERLCLRLLLQQQPVARDLRLISAALKMITDMERIGDQAADISEIVMATDLRDCVGQLKLGQMAENVIRMVTDSLDAFVRRDHELVRSVIAHDDVVDSLFNEIKTELIAMIATDVSKGEQAMDILMIAKYLERIGDHAVNVAEWVEFSITGKHEE